MRIGIYARVSTSDKDQDPTTQLLPLREFTAVQGWQAAGEFVDHASANDLRGRKAWRALLDQAAPRRMDVILVWKLDRAFRSVAHMATTTEQLRRWGVGLRSYSEPWLDTSGTSPVGDLMLNILASFAQFERALIAERVRAGMARARKQGKHVGRPQALNGNLEALRPLIESGTLSRRDQGHFATGRDDPLAGVGGHSQCRREQRISLGDSEPGAVEKGGYIPARSRGSSGQMKQCWTPTGVVVDRERPARPAVTNPTGPTIFH